MYVAGLRSIPLWLGERNGSGPTAWASAALEMRRKSDDLAREAVGCNGGLDGLAPILSLQ
jgi:hypothetical protein